MGSSRVHWAGLVALTLVVTAQVFAQEQGDRQRGRGGPPRGGFGGGFGGGDVLNLLQSPELIKELKITDDEKAYIKMAADETREQDQKFFADSGFRDMPREERGAKMAEWMAKRTADTEAKLAEIIGKDRVKRLKEIQLQVAGPRQLLFSSQLQKDLNITEDQKKQMETAMREAMTEGRELFRDNSGTEDERAARREEFMEKQKAKIMGVLTDAQKAKWKEMQGEPISFKIEQRGPGGPSGDRPDRNRRDRNRPDDRPNAEAPAAK